MAFREALFVAGKAAAKKQAANSIEHKLHATAKDDLGKIRDTRRNTFWGQTPIVTRTRQYKNAGEIRDE